MKKLFALYLLFAFIIHDTKAQEALKYSKRQVSDDVVFFLKNALEIHPNLYHSISERQLKTKCDSLLNTLPDSLLELGTYRVFAVLTAFIGEKYTGVYLPKSSLLSKQIKGRELLSVPIQVTDYENQYFNANIFNKDVILQNIRITSINKNSSENILKDITSMIGGSASYKKKIAIADFRFLVRAVGIKAPYLVEYLDSKMHKSFITLNELTEKDFIAAKLKTKQSRPCSLVIQNDGYAYMDLNFDNNTNSVINFCDSTFDVLNKRQINKLVIDLRECGSSYTIATTFLLNYITDKPFPFKESGEKKISQQFKDSTKEYLDMKNGTFLTIGSSNGFDLTNTATVTTPHKSPKFKGKVCFLIGANTFASGNVIASTVKDFNLATLIGEPTGEPANTYGSICNFTLPETGFLGFTSTTLWLRPNKDKSDNNPISPDHLIKRKNSYGDNVLDYAVNWLNK